MTKALFDEARKAWPGDKNGIGPEWDTFLKVCKKYKLEPTKTVPLLLPAIEQWEKTVDMQKAYNKMIGGHG